MESKKNRKKVAWIHNFNRNPYISSGIWMFKLYDSIKHKESEIKIDLIDIGNINNPFLLIKKIFKYKRIFKEYDILHAQYGSGTGFFTSLFPNQKLLSLRGSDWYYFKSPNLAERFHSWLSCFLSKRSLNKFKTIIVMSERMKTEINSEFVGLDVRVIPDGIDLNTFYPTESNKNKLPFRVLFSSVDSNNRIKRYNLAEKAFNIFHEKYPESELVFMHGISHEKVNEFINKADVILLTSVHEGWPNIIKEGMACNVPFVSTDVSDLQNIVRQTNCCIVCKDDPESLAEGIESVYLSDNEINIRHFTNQFEIQEVTAKLIEIYREHL